jgi:DNA-binding transcriptional MocR family regulator
MDTISFAGDGLAPDLIPTEELADCAATALEQDGSRILSYGTGAGYTPLRELLAERFGVHPFRVLVTPGWLQGFALVTRGRITGRTVIVEYPTYDKAMQVLFASSVSLIYLDWAGDVPNLDLLDATIRTNQGKPALAYLIPTFHNPTGRVIDDDSRYKLGSMLHRHGIQTVEDDTYGLLRFEGEPIETIFEMSAKTMIYSFSFSALIAPGLRVGVFILPEELADDVATQANDTYITPPLLPQATVFEFMNRGGFEPHVEWLRERLRERRDAMVDALEHHLPDGTWFKPEGGIFVSLALEPGTDARALLDAAEGIDASTTEPGYGLPNAVRLNFAACAPDEIEPGIERLAAAIRSAAPV